MAIPNNSNDEKGNAAYSTEVLLKIIMYSYYNCFIIPDSHLLYHNTLGDIVHNNKDEACLTINGFSYLGFVKM